MRLRRLVGAALIGVWATAGAQPVLDPQWAAGPAARLYAARSGVVQFHLLAPGLAGHRLAIALQSTDRRDAARAALSRFIAAGKSSRKNCDDAEWRLAELR